MIPREQVKAAVHDLATTRDGQIFLQWLAESLGMYHYGLEICETTKDLNMNAIIYNQARRGVYLDIRGLIPKQIRQTIEGRILTQEDEADARRNTPNDSSHHNSSVSKSRVPSGRDFRK